MKTRLAYILIVVLFVAGLPAIGQDNVIPTECTTETVAELASFAQARVDGALPSIESGDLIGAMDELQVMQNRIRAMRALCDGLVFEGDSEGQKSIVLGPVTFPDGVYRGVVTTDGFLSLTMSGLSGNCDTSFSFFLFEGDAVDGAEALFEAEGCIAMMEVSNISAPWKVEFQRLTVGD